MFLFGALLFLKFYSSDIKANGKQHFLSLAVLRSIRMLLGGFMLKLMLYLL